eukprot:m51a1_g13569 hypothetical protein (401) ;mRNA; f:467-2163
MHGIPTLLVAGACLLSAGVALGLDLTPHFATVRSYTYNGGTPSAPLPNCSLSGVYYVSRHGSRYPTAGKIKKQEGLGEAVRQYTARPGNEWMSTWKPMFSRDQDGMLSERGAADLMQIGARFARNYKALLAKYSPNRVTTQSTEVPRTAQTAAAFSVGAVTEMGGVWARKPWVAVSESQKRDKELRFFDVCQRYVAEVADNESSAPEVAKFTAEAYARIARKLENATGIPAADLIAKDMVERMWDTCTYELTVHGQRRWCDLFDAEDAAVFEYVDDMEKYYARGYGIALSYRIAAPLLQSVFKYAADVVAEKEGTPKAKLMFGHAETVLPLKALLGLHRDATPLVASLTAEQREQRLWRTSHICTMAANVAFVVSKCGDGAHQIQLLEDETPVDFPADRL